MTETVKTGKLYGCKFCGGETTAEQFSNSLNEVPARDLRLLCYCCAPVFNRLPLGTRRRFLQDKINAVYGVGGGKQFIYALCDPQTEIIRYLGRTTHPNRRFNQHLQLTRDFAKQLCHKTGITKFNCDCITHKAVNKRPDAKRWISALMAKGLKPVMTVLEEVDPGWVVHEREMRHICQLVKENYKLLNYERQSESAAALIKKQPFSFLTIEIEVLEKSGFMKSFESFLSREVSHESGWRRALLLHRVFSTDIDLRFDESTWNNNTDGNTFAEFQS